MVTAVNLTGQNWLITPAVNPPEASFRPAIGYHWRKCKSTLASCVVWIGHSEFCRQWVDRLGFWRPLRIVPDVSAPLASVSGSIVAENLAFNLVMWAPFASISSVTSDDYNINGGFAIHDWRPTPFIAGPYDSSGGYCLAGLSGH